MISSPLFCPTCGAANTAQATQCFACGHTLQAPAPTQNEEALLKQRYHLLNRLGQGGMGSVYRAEDTELGNRLVAIKEMSQKGLNQQEADEATNAFKREALLLAGLMHPNLPRIYDHFSEQGRWYLIMDFIEGQTLEDYLTQHGGTLPLEEVLEYGTQLCSVLQYLHTRQPPIIFRDLKPDNVLRTSDGHLYLIDFGIARHFKPGQARDTIAFGSPGYAAPEQYGKAQTGPSADIYSLGVMLHQMITGEDPTLKPFFFVPLYMKGPPRLQSLLNQMLDMDASKRPEDIALVKQTLQSIAQQDLSWYNKASQTPAQVVPPTSFVLPTPPVQSTQILHVVPTPPVRRSPIGEVVTTYTQHSDWIAALAWSPDEKYIASASYDKTVQVWEPSTGKLKNLYTHHTSFWIGSRVHSLSWSPDSSCIASGGDDKTVRIWKIGVEEPLAMYHDHHDSVLAVAWSPDGKYIASASGITTFVWDVDTQKTLLNFGSFTRPVQALAWSPDSKLLAIGGWNDTIYVHDCSLRKTTQSAIAYREHSDFVQALAWSPDGIRIASASNDKTVRLWDPQTGQTLLTYRGHTDAVKAVAWSPDGKYIASAGVDTTVQVWDPQTGKLIFIYNGHFGTVYGLAWSKASKYIASGDAHNLVQVWRAT